MRKLISLLAITAVILTSCSTDSETESYEALDQAEFEVTGKALTPTTVATAGSTAEVCAVTNLIAGDQHNAGKLTVLADDDNLYIKYESNNRWVIDATRMFVGERADIPTSSSTGNPRTWYFPYKATHNFGTNQVEYTIPLADIPDCFTVAAFATVTRLDINGVPIYCDDAWTEGRRIGTNWAMATDFCKTGCSSGSSDQPIRIR